MITTSRLKTASRACFLRAALTILIPLSFALMINTWRVALGSVWIICDLVLFCYAYSTLKQLLTRQKTAQLAIDALMVIYGAIVIIGLTTVVPWALTGFRAPMSVALGIILSLLILAWGIPYLILAIQLLQASLPQANKLGLSLMAALGLSLVSWLPLVGLLVPLAWVAVAFFMGKMFLEVAEQKR